MNGFTLSTGIGTIPHIAGFAGVQQLSRNPFQLLTSQVSGVYSWGSKPYSRYSVRIAEFFGLPHIRLEDGFVCSFGRSEKQRKYSIVADPIGIYYDSTSASLLENILNGFEADSAKLADAAVVERAERLIAMLTERNISKYNYIESTPVDLQNQKDYALVIDQTVGDQSVRLGGMSAERFVGMLNLALEEFPADKVFVKVHPQVLTGRKRGYLAEAARERGVRMIAGEIPLSRLRECARVYVGTSLFGMEALLRGVPVVCCGQPFYSGWGVTRDIRPVSRRKASRSVTEIFIASYLLYPRYIDPISGQSCVLEDIIEHIAVQSQQRERIGKKLTCIGITPWKRRYIDRYLMRNDFSHRHVSVKSYLKKRGVGGTTQEKDDSSCGESPLLVWGRQSPETALEQTLAGHRVVRMEDGFVRSVGLGSNFTAPRSLVIDDVGIYFDATRPSRMENLLQHHECTVTERDRAQSLIDALLAQRISKYTGASGGSHDCGFYQGKNALLVIGQVDGDASLRFGGDEIKTNLALLKEVKKHNPGRCIVYKPHPDVVSGNRSDGIDNYRDISDVCDHIENRLPIEAALRVCEEIHTITSLAGLEALLCGKKVVTYGKPFYAGWGLTEDLCLFERRTRKRTLQELVFISYVRYPAYLDIDSGEFTSVEKTISAILAERDESRGPITATGLKKYVNIVRNIKKGLTYAA